MTTSHLTMRNILLGILEKELIKKEMSTYLLTQIQFPLFPLTISKSTLFATKYAEKIQLFLFIGYDVEKWVVGDKLCRIK